jgi:hypothetical protein
LSSNLSWSRHRRKVSMTELKRLVIEFREEAAKR